MTSSNSDTKQARLEELERAVENLQADQAIVRTLYSYSHALDYGLVAEFFDCFTNDGRWHKIKVKVTPPRGLPRLFVRSKDGYYAVPSSR